MRLLIAPLLLLAALSAFAAPADSTTLEKRQIEIIPPEAIAAFKPYSFYAASAYCDPSVLKTWTCGVNCNANSGFRSIAAGGDGGLVQFWYVGYDPSLATIIVGHQGTDATKIIPILTNVDIVFDNLDSSLFPGVSSSVKVHRGFSAAQERSARDVIAAVNAAVTTYGTKTITVVGHSLGAAISLIDALYLKINIPDSAVKFYGYGMLRVGNQEFANLIDNKLDYFVRITNLKDPVPIIPGSWKQCPGQDNTDKQCSVGDVPNILVGNYDDHSGPYDGVTMGCQSSSFNERTHVFSLFVN